MESRTATGHADLQASRPAVHVSLSRVGVTGVEKVIRIGEPGRAGDELLRARAGRHALGGHADQAPRATRRGHRRAVERVDLLRRDARHGRRLVLGVAGGDRDLGAKRVLAFAHALGDALRQELGLEARLAQDHLADGIVDHLLEARHVSALLARAQVDEALQPRREELLDGVLAGPRDADHLLDAGDADPGERNVQRGGRGLHVGRARDRVGLHGGGAAGRRVAASRSGPGRAQPLGGRRRPAGPRV